MKRILFFLLLALLTTSVSAQSKNKGPRHNISHPIDGRKGRLVTIQDRPVPADSMLWFQPIDDVLTYHLCEGGHHDDTLLVCSATHDSLIPTDHPLIDGVRTAYAGHFPLVLTPDAVWLVIANGFAVHIDRNAEQLRPQLVNFDGQMTLSINCKPGLLHQPAEAWEPYFTEFSKELKGYAPAKLVDDLTCDFSTTTPAAFAASQITIMSALQPYFVYEIIESCGIPQVYLQGSAKDWKRLIKKANGLRQYGLGWWIDELEPVLQKIAAAAGGEYNPDFWKSIYRDKASGVDEGYCGLPEEPTKINGWIVKFYPYDSDGNRNTLDDFDENDITKLPCEHRFCPLKYKELGGAEHDLNLSAGLMGLWRDPVTKALRPEIAWSISSH